MHRTKYYGIHLRCRGWLEMAFGGMLSWWVWQVGEEAWYDDDDESLSIGFHLRPDEAVWSRRMPHRLRVVFRWVEEGKKI